MVEKNAANNLAVLTGGLPFAIDLIRELDEMKFINHFDTIGLKRYSGDEKAGAVEIVSKPHANLSDREIMVIEDVIDAGETMN